MTEPIETIQVNSNTGISLCTIHSAIRAGSWSNAPLPCCCRTAHRSAWLRSMCCNNAIPTPVRRALCNSLTNRGKMGQGDEGPVPGSGRPGCVRRFFRPSRSRFSAVFRPLHCIPCKHENPSALADRQAVSYRPHFGVAGVRTETLAGQHRWTPAEPAAYPLPPLPLERSGPAHVFQRNRHTQAAIPVAPPDTNAAVVLHRDRKL